MKVVNRRAGHLKRLIALPFLLTCACADLGSLLGDVAKEWNRQHPGPAGYVPPDPTPQPQSPRQTAEPISSFVSEELRDWGTFSTTTLRGTPILEICVRDYDCEDGDRIAVMLNGQSVMNVELRKRTECQRFGFPPGQDVITVYAVNGTGYKGNCDFSDVNTGEITISSVNDDGSVDRSLAQTYRIRSGTGTMSRIVVTAR